MTCARCYTDNHGNLTRDETLDDLVCEAASACAIHVAMQEACETCKGTGYVTLPGLRLEWNDALASMPQETQAALAVPGAVSTAYRCEFCARCKFCNPVKR